MPRFEQFLDLRGVSCWTFSAAILALGLPTFTHVDRLSPDGGLGSVSQQAGGEQLAGMGEMNSGSEAGMGEMGGMDGGKGAMGGKGMQHPSGEPTPGKSSHGPMPHASPGKGADQMEKHMDEMHRHMENMHPSTAGAGAPSQQGSDTRATPVPDPDM